MSASPVRVMTSTGSFTLEANAGRSLLAQCWEEVDRLVEILMAPGVDKTEIVYHQNSGRLLGMANLLALFMHPHLTTEKEILSEGVRRKKARDAGELYETAGIGSRRLEGPPTSAR